MFHNQFYGLGNMEICMVGDLDHNEVDKNLSKVFKSWKISPLNKEMMVSNLKSKDLSGKSSVVYIPDKSSADLILGHGIGIDNNHKDYLNIH